MGDFFQHVRLKTVVLYFGFMFSTVFVSGLIADFFIVQAVNDAFAGATYPSADQVIQDIEQIRMTARIAMLPFFAIGAYFVLGLTLKPIKDMVSAQKRFVANVSHELRTPLSLMKTETEVALRDPKQLSLEESLALHKKNLGRIDHVAQIIQFFLALSEFNTPAVHSPLRMVPLDTVLRTVRDTLTHVAQTKHITLVLDFKTTDTTVKGNPIALEKMVLNLMRNATIYTPEGGTITASLTRKGNILTLSIADTGRGIPKAELSQIFEPFYRGTNAEPMGTGLGLSIVREVVRLHNATIDVKSDEGRGTTFSIMFTT